MKLIDTPAFQRLRHISQLGLVGHVYPAANHHRFEHSLGVFRMALLFLRQLAHQQEFAEIVSPAEAESFLLAALLHDIGHWPFCHPIEDMSLPEVDSHEAMAARFIGGEEIKTLIENDWSASVDDVLTLINRTGESRAERLLQSVLSGPIDIDKMDYLYRDSLHAGVPYGQNFDAPRLIGSLCLNESGDRLAISHKGRTAAEMMIFSRYIMFSEVYWHHAVRSATAMLQRAFYLSRDTFRDQDQSGSWFALGEHEMLTQWMAGAEGVPAELLEQLFGPKRRLYKRVASFSYSENRELFDSLSRRRYQELVDRGSELAVLLSERTGTPFFSDDVLIDAPPMGLEVQCNIEVKNLKSNKFQPLSELSPVVDTLARNQFDNFVKRVRIFVPPEKAEVAAAADLPDLIARLSKGA